MKCGLGMVWKLRQEMSQKKRWTMSERLQAIGIKNEQCLVSWAESVLVTCSTGILQKSQWLWSPFFVARVQEQHKVLRMPKVKDCTKYK